MVKNFLIAFSGILSIAFTHGKHSLLIFSKFIELYTHQHPPILEHFQHPIHFCQGHWLSILTPTSQPQGTNDLLSCFYTFAFSEHSYKGVIQYAVFCICLPSQHDFEVHPLCITYRQLVLLLLNYTLLGGYTFCLNIHELTDI